MYPVSNDYLSAVRSKTRSDRLTGSITLSGGRVIPISDSVLVRDSLRLTRELCRSKYRIGTFNIACLRFNIFIDNALGLDLTGAYAELEYGIQTGSSYENVPLGKFFIDPVLSIRRKNILSIVAYDEGVKFEVQLSDTLRNMEATPDALIAAACTECGVSTDITAAYIADLPNSALTVCPDDRQIQTCRDMIMWCAALMCCYASIDRSSKLVLIPAKYAVSPEDSTVIVTNRTVSENERRSITVTDTRAYIKYLTAYAEDDVVSYTSTYVSPDAQAAPAAYVLEKNPLLSSCSRQVCNTANAAWLSYIDAFKQRGVNAEIFGDPAVDIGDTIAFRGGDVDQRGSIIGVVTGIEWRYRGCMIIECLAAECCGSLVGDRPAAISSNVRKQHRKRVDSPKTSSGSGGVGEFVNNDRTSERFNDYENNATSGSYDHIEGKNNKSTSVLSGDAGTVNHMSGRNNTLASGSSVCHVEGEYNKAEQNSSHCHVEGYGNTVSAGSRSFIGGNWNVVQAPNNSIVYGSDNTVPGAVRSVISGQSNIISGSCDSVLTGYGHNVSNPEASVVAGSVHRASGTRPIYNSVLGGYENTLSGLTASLACGTQNIAVSTTNSVIYGYNNNSSNAVRCLEGGSGNTVTSSHDCIVTGSGNVVSSAYCGMILGSNGTLTYGTVMAVGNGGSSSDLRNCFTVDTTGSVTARAYITSGADYAEYFEWADGNPENEDRRGMLVALVGDKLVPADDGDILGVVTAAPAVVGNACENQWHGVYECDVFGAPICDEDGKPVISAGYDPSREYIPRSKRPEWAAVGIVGRLIVKDNGRCAPGEYVSADHGFAVPASGRTDVRCLKRADYTHIEVLIK